MTSGPGVPPTVLAEIYSAVGPLYRRAVRTITETGPGQDLPVGVRAVLELLGVTGPLPVPHLAAHLERARQVVQRSVDEAARRGLTGTRRNPHHQRSSLIALTADGRARLAAVHAHEEAALRDVAATVDPDDAAACLRVLRALLADLRDHPSG